MSEEEQALAKCAWDKAEFPPVSDSMEDQEESAAMEKEENEKIEKAMVSFMHNEMKWTHKELHDALLVAGVSVPAVPSMRNCVAALHAQYGNTDTGFLPQSFQSHKQRKAKINLANLCSHGDEIGWHAR